MKVKCHRCGKMVSVTSARKVNSLYFSSGCFSRIVSRQNLKGLDKTHSVERVCESCGRRYLASDNEESLCGNNRNRCCFCCEYSSSMKYGSVMCPLESERLGKNLYQIESFKSGEE